MQFTNGKYLLIIQLIVIFRWTGNYHSRRLGLVYGLEQNTDDGKLRVCIVEARGIYRKTPKFCPILQRSNVNMECVVGLDHLDCVRRIHKGSAHFTVLTSEDLVAARWSGVEVLVTNELRSHDSPFEYELVVVVDNEANIHTANDLPGSKLCHPGYGLGNHWTEILVNYLEGALVPRTCESGISLIEDRIRSTSKFFGPSCKAGPWVPNTQQDHQLKSRYPSLCQMCYDSYRCDIGDKHWGRRGVLYCLTSGGGNVAWARLDDVRSHFGLTGLTPQADPTEYSYLCIDGYLQPINTTKPCVWVAKPWPVVVAHSSIAVQIQQIVTNLKHDEPNSWENALLSLLETYHVDVIALDTVIPIDDYLDQATAFQSAYSFPECNPPRAIVFCTKSILEHIKCSWLQESAQVYGVQPNIQCIRSASLDTCLDDVQYKSADIVLIDHDERLKAEHNYQLEPILYEFANDMHERYTIIALVDAKHQIEHFNDLRGLKACLPSYEGSAYLSVLETIANLSESGHSSYDSVEKFFHSDSCIWKPNGRQQTTTKTCPLVYRGDEGALRCLLEKGDVAFLSSKIYKEYMMGNLTNDWIQQLDHHHKLKTIRIFCPYGGNERFSKVEYCYLHWTNRGHFMIRKNIPVIRRNEIYNTLKSIDSLFGRTYQTESRIFSMYGLFDNHSNVIFQDGTDTLKGLPELRKDINKRLLESIYTNYPQLKNQINNRATTIDSICTFYYYLIILIFSLKNSISFLKENF